MKKISIFGCIAAALLSLAGCDPTGNEGFEGTNYIYLESEGGKTTLIGDTDDPITVNVNLTTALANDLTLEFAVEGHANALSVTGNPVTIPAGSKTASFTIGVASVEGLPDIANYTVSLATADLPGKVQFETPFYFSVVTIEVPEITLAQQAIIDGYKATTGVDLSKYLGVVTVNSVITGTDPDTYEPLEPLSRVGKTIITLSESSTADAPVLKMLVNPMGVQDYMYDILKSVTVGYSDWYAEYASELYAEFMEAIAWSATTEESFNMTLDGITLDTDKNIDFLDSYLDEYEEECVRVPFDYYYTAYEREKTAISEGVVNPEEYGEDWPWDATANPAVHLNNSDIMEDWFEYGNWIEPSAAISNSELKFTFCFYACWLDGDFTRVVATYTPNN